MQNLFRSQLLIRPCIFQHNIRRACMVNNTYTHYHFESKRFFANLSRRSLVSKNFYELLDINNNASLDEVKKAYRKKAFQWHPDRHAIDKDTATVRFREISEAYETLSNATKRESYDSALRSGVDPSKVKETYQEQKPFTDEMAQTLWKSFMTGLLMIPPELAPNAPESLKGFLKSIEKLINKTPPSLKPLALPLIHGGIMLAGFFIRTLISRGSGGYLPRK